MLHPARKAQDRERVSALLLIRKLQVCVLAEGLAKSNGAGRVVTLVLTTEPQLNTRDLQARPLVAEQPILQRPGVVPACKHQFTIDRTRLLLDHRESILTSLSDHDDATRRGDPRLGSCNGLNAVAEILLVVHVH